MFVQFHIIAWFFNKINPYLKKIFVFCKKYCKMPNCGARRTAEAAVKREKSGRILSSWQNGEIAKNWECCRERHLLLCKLEVNIPQIYHKHAPLWKSLWNLWKSFSFPQCEAGKGKIPQAQVVYNFLYNHGNKVAITGLRRLHKSVNGRSFWEEKVRKKGCVFLLCRLLGKRTLEFL